MTEEDLIEERLRTAKPIPVNESLFDGKVSSNMENNLEYMRRQFSFFIPEIENLVDLDGFLAYLGEKVGIGYTCLYCNKSHQSLVAVRSHMVMLPPALVCMHVCVCVCVRERERERERLSHILIST